MKWFDRNKECAIKQEIKIEYLIKEIGMNYVV